jgi:hypothetical protein
MTEPAGSGGLALDSFDVIDDFTAQLEKGTLSEAERALHGEHPFVTLIESVLEQLSTSQLGELIVGFSLQSEKRLREKRRKLEKAHSREGLQKLLFRYGELCQLIRESGYGSKDPESSSKFFESAFPQWLDAIRDWAADEQLAALGVRLGTAFTTYSRMLQTLIS